jgi:S-DNA-T family DNA segregation ATPase FtsK/SpoIIIE
MKGAISIKRIVKSIKKIRLYNGIQNICKDKWKLCFPALFSLIMLFIWAVVRGKILLIENAMFSAIILWSFSLLMIGSIIIGLLYIIAKIGTPLSAKRVENCLKGIGFYDKFGNTPLLLSKNKEDKAIVYEFYSNTLSIFEYKKRCSDIETALNLHIVGFDLGHDFQHIFLKTVSVNNNFDKTLLWNNNLISPDDFVINIGESQIDTVSINLNATPHILIGGSTGSGKTVLLKLILMQCVRKNADVYIADFKGGVDYPRQWHKYCKMQFTVEQFSRTLIDILEVLEDRKRVFREESCSNIAKYNKIHFDNPMKRIIVVCDEIAEVLDKTGLDKESKAEVTKIESMLSTIARQGRAFGVHLILATQRPDSEVLKGQIKNNIDFRICGKADKVLSQIILDNPDGAEKIPKDKQGIFLTNTGVLFKAYYFDDSEW